MIDRLNAALTDRYAAVRKLGGADFATGEVQVFMPSDTCMSFGLNRAYAFDGGRDRFLMIPTVSSEIAHSELI